MVVYAISATFSWFLIERIGRRKLFLIGTFGQLLSMVLVFACLAPGAGSNVYGAAVGLFTYIAFFGATWLPLPWLFPAEINGLRTRARANGERSRCCVSSFLMLTITCSCFYLLKLALQFCNCYGHTHHDRKSRCFWVWNVYFLRSHERLFHSNHLLFLS